MSAKFEDRLVGLFRNIRIIADTQLHEEGWRYQKREIDSFDEVVNSFDDYYTQIESTLKEKLAGDICHKIELLNSMLAHLFKKHSGYVNVINALDDPDWRRITSMAIDIVAIWDA